MPITKGWLLTCGSGLCRRGKKHSRSSGFFLGFSWGEASAWALQSLALKEESCEVFQVVQGVRLVVLSAYFKVQKSTAAFSVPWHARAGKRLSISSGSEVSRGVMGADVSFQHVLYSTAGSPGRFSCRGSYREPGELCWKIEVAGVTAKSLESRRCIGSFSLAGRFHLLRVYTVSSGFG